MVGLATSWISPRSVEKFDQNQSFLSENPLFFGNLEELPGVLPERVDPLNTGNAKFRGQPGVGGGVAG
jgi:hypothetical protein